MVNKVFNIRALIVSVKKRMELTRVTDNRCAAHFPSAILNCY